MQGFRNMGYYWKGMVVTGIEKPRC